MSLVLSRNLPIDFDSDRQNAQELLRQCALRDVGTMTIKSIAKEPWGETEKRYTTWYEPFEEQDEIQAGVNFVLSQDVTGLCTAGEVHLLPMVLQACENYTPLSEIEQEELIARGKQMVPLFA